MTRTMTIVAGVLICGGALPVARASCGPAPQPAFAIPDGTHASKDEMSAARDNLSEYSAQVAAYAACLDAAQADSGRNAATDVRLARERYLDLGSAALLRLASVVSCFSAQVQAFNVSGGGSDAGPAQCPDPGADRAQVSFPQAARQPR
jgi:hypothetical protein